MTEKQLATESVVVIDHVVVDIPDHLDLTFQTLPEYDVMEAVICAWQGDDLRYFILFMEIDDDALKSPEAWIEDIRSTISKIAQNSVVKLTRHPHDVTTQGATVTPVETAFTYRDIDTRVVEAAFHIQSDQQVFTAVAVQCHDAEYFEHLDEVSSIIKTVSIDDTVVNLRKRSEEYLSGIWEGTVSGPDAPTVDVHLELKNDFTFIRRESTPKHEAVEITGCWSFGQDAINWQYLENHPIVPPMDPLPEDDIWFYDGDTLVLFDKQTRLETVLNRLS